jgi:hypothetical protein
MLALFIQCYGFDPLVPIPFQHTLVGTSGVSSGQVQVRIQGKRAPADLPPMTKDAPWRS